MEIKSKKEIKEVLAIVSEDDLTKYQDKLNDGWLLAPTLSVRYKDGTAVVLVREV